MITIKIDPVLSMPPVLTIQSGGIILLDERGRQDIADMLSQYRTPDVIQVDGMRTERVAIDPEAANAKAMKIKLETSQSTCGDLRLRLDEVGAARVKNMELAEQAQKRVDQLTAMVAQYDIGVAQTRAEIGGLRERAHDLEAENAKLRVRLEELRAERDAVKAVHTLCGPACCGTINRLKTDLEEVSAECKHLHDELTTSRACLHEAVAQRDVLSDELEKRPELSFEQMRDILSAAVGRRLAPEWRPIESAPKDGTYVLLTGTALEWKRNPKAVSAHWRKDLQSWKITGGSAEITICDVTHWQPLPEPPK